MKRSMLSMALAFALAGLPALALDTPARGPQPAGTEKGKKGKRSGPKDGSGPIHTPGTGGGTGAGPQKGPSAGPRDGSGPIHTPGTGGGAGGGGMRGRGGQRR